MLSDYIGDYWLHDGLTTDDHAGSPAYDLNIDFDGSGTVDPDDLSDFLAAYFAHDGLRGPAAELLFPGELAIQHDHGGRTLGLADNIFGWCGYVYDQASELYCVRHRHFDPSLGRWLQRDPAGFADSMNLYGYGWGNSIGVNDPMGLDIRGDLPDPGASGLGGWSPGELWDAGMDAFTGGASTGELQRGRDDYCRHLARLYADGRMSAEHYAKAKQNAKCGGSVRVEIAAAAAAGAVQGAVDGVVMAADNYTFGMIPSLNQAANCIRDENAHDWMYAAGDLASQISRDVAIAAALGGLSRAAGCVGPLGTAARAADAVVRGVAAGMGGYNVGQGISRVASGDSGGWWQIAGGLVEIGMAVGIPKMSACFVAGTAIATPDGQVEIQHIRVGNRVLTENLSADSTQVDPTTWRQVALVIPDKNGDKAYDVRIITLRPVTWLNEAGAKPGAWVDFDLPEMNVKGPALVVDARPCPAIQPGPGRVVLSTYTRAADNVIDLIVRGKEGAGKPETLGITANHLLYSLDRFDGTDATSEGSWIAAGDLKDCERIRAADGWAIVESVNRQWRTEQVFNLEVEGEHTYLTGAVGVVSHNANPCPNPWRKAGLPTRHGNYRYVPPKGVNKSKPPKGPSGGYLDRHGNEWVKGPNHHFDRRYEYEWDVQLPGGGHVNVSPDGVPVWPHGTR